MSNTVLIKEVNNVLVIFNVDNAVDAARLEALQAVKMAEDLVGSVFGENSRYADNTTCLVTDNPANPAYPYNVTFDESKIMDTPKRNTAMLAQMAMPSGKYIEYNIPVNKDVEKIAPANGYFTLWLKTKSSRGRLSCSNITSEVSNSLYTDITSGNFSVFVPVKANDRVIISIISDNEYSCKFIYAEGEI